MAHNAKFAIQNLFNVEGWVVVVSGGGSGIGLMITRAFANNGARVYIIGRSSPVLEQAAHEHGQSLLSPYGRIVPVMCDITDKDSIQQTVNLIKLNESHIDLLVNSSNVAKGKSDMTKGDLDPPETFAEELWRETVEDWETVYRTNVIGDSHLRAATSSRRWRLCPSWLARQARGHAHTPGVINITSVSGMTRTTQNHINYNVSKAAAIQLSTLLAQELRRRALRIRVNNVAPGLFPSEIMTDETEEVVRSTWAEPNFGKVHGVPANRPGSDEDIAQAVLMLACNQYAYGQTLVIDGGYLLEHP
ncbi:hypothetical protein EWM64_g489 [Hericium alpestre]|uniref:Ketoreductase (KR) domain-containing protein n=1 Tax=Hericium alpestre TaxID=135208 RepID=A0A4Z0AAH7_9AGAM|nr:hypothetical protein EWM64_g489 [Hericium alpestre]